MRPPSALDMMGERDWHVGASRLVTSMQGGIGDRGWPILPVYNLVAALVQGGDLMSKPV